MAKFSERVGAAPPMPIQLEGMNATLRTSIWNFILQIIDVNLLDATTLIGTHLLKQPQHLIPDNSFYDARNWLWHQYEKLQWHQIYDLFEFVVENSHPLSSRSKYKDVVINAANILLAEEVSGYRFLNGVLGPITDKNEITEIEQAVAQSNTIGLQGVRTHLEAALQLLAKKPQPDYRNSIKESISAVEAAVKKISGEHAGGLNAALKLLAKHVEIPGGLQAGFLSLYGYTSDKSGIRHAILEETKVGFDEAKFMLVACSAFVNFLICKADRAGMLGQ